MKISSILLVAMGLVILAGCSVAEETAVEPAVAQADEPEPPVINDPLATGDAAPNFTLPDSNGNMVNLADALQDNQLVVLVFYFGHG